MPIGPSMFSRCLKVTTFSLYQPTIFDQPCLIFMFSSIFCEISQLNVLPQCRLSGNITTMYDGILLVGIYFWIWGMLAITGNNLTSQG